MRLDPVIWYYSLHARCEALWHLVRGHQLKWRTEIDLWVGMTGCIECVDCPDATARHGEPTTLHLWCRDNRLVWWIARAICTRLGHKPTGVERTICSRCVSDL